MCTVWRTVWCTAVQMLTRQGPGRDCVMSQSLQWLSGRHGPAARRSAWQYSSYNYEGVGGGGGGLPTNQRQDLCISQVGLSLTFLLFIKYLRRTFHISRQILFSEGSDWETTAEKCDTFLTIHLFIQIINIWQRLPALDNCQSPSGAVEVASAG